MTGQEQNIYEGIHMPHNTNICSKQAKRFKCIRDGPELRQKIILWKMSSNSLHRK